MKKTVQIGDTVKYALTPEETEAFNHPENHTINAVVQNVAANGETLIKAEIKQGVPWQKGTFEGTGPGRFSQLLGATGTEMPPAKKPAKPRVKKDTMIPQKSKKR